MQARNGTLPLHYLTAISQLGFADEAFELIDQSTFEDRLLMANSTVSSGVIFGRENEVMKCDVRFLGLCAKLRLCDYWVETDRWPDCACQVPYDFKSECLRMASQRGR